MTNQIGEKIVEVDFASNFQDSTISSSVLTFETEDLKEKILSAPKEQLLLVKSTVNSPKNIISVEYYNKELILSSL